MSLALKETNRNWKKPFLRQEIVALSSFVAQKTKDRTWTKSDLRHTIMKRCQFAACNQYGSLAKYGGDQGRYWFQGDKIVTVFSSQRIPPLRYPEAL
jgi:hypothetical protein